MKRREYSQNEARIKAEAFCSSCEHSISEVETKLHQWGADEYSKEIVDRLIKEKYIDESRFCKAFVRDKYRFNHWGRNKIVQTLKMKRISEQNIADALLEIESEEYDANLMALISKKRKSVKGKNEYECNAKIIKFALSKGYEMKSIMKYINMDGFDEEFPD